MNVTELIEKRSVFLSDPEKLRRFGIELLEMVKDRAEAKCTPHSKGSHVATSYAVELDKALEELHGN